MVAHPMQVRFPAFVLNLTTVMAFVIFTQLVHFSEHALQVFQLTALHVPGPQAKALFGQFFDTEWLHFTYNTYMLAMLLFFLTALWACGPCRRWLLIGLLVALVHEAEHVYLIHNYLLTGKQGLPGLVGKGSLTGLLPDLARPYVHFGYNIIETVPILFAYSASRIHFGRSIIPGRKRKPHCARHKPSTLALIRDLLSTFR